ncbi:hypothetical protein BRADI_2g41971v3 [Brachypodium distachyon]|uniref:Uncharacterized protein n=1 Tax=Brachypodium distachyon TaxID=15368 RepID=A0A2K2DDB3_BRADI|nr:hypothetical protein BRADI_2g41971v3 [Brachypodium distachyon]
MEVVHDTKCNNTTPRCTVSWITPGRLLIRTYIRTRCSYVAVVLRELSIEPNDLIWGAWTDAVLGHCLGVASCAYNIWSSCG